MRTLRILLRHHATRWVRDPSWGTGTVVGQIVLVGLLLLSLLPLGAVSYVLGDVLRELYPEADVLKLINGGMLYLVPALMAGRFMFQPPPSERVTAYAALPVSMTGLVNGQVLFSLLSAHTVFAVVLVGPVWATEVATVWSPEAAAAWLATALLLTVVLANHGAILLHLLMGRQSWGALGLVALGAGFGAADALLGLDGFRAVSQVFFGRPAVGLASVVVLTAGTHAALLRVMLDRLEVDQRATMQGGDPSRRGGAIYEWIEHTLPAGRLVALELRQLMRAKRLQGLALLGIAFTIYFVGSEVLSSGRTVGATGMVGIGIFGLGGPALGLGCWMFGTSAGYAEGLFARPNALEEIVWAKLTVLWAGLLPGGLVLIGTLPWVKASHAALLGAFLLCWIGVIVPGLVYMAPRFRKPVDTYASFFSMNTNIHGLRVLLVLLFVPVIVLAAHLTGAWWTTATILGVGSAGSLLGLVYTLRPLTGTLDRHRHDMLQGFRENEPI